ncbi:MAG TPA: amidohydrolase family protein [Acidimicrobiales bacterium]|nr:amidohydrolase family protein [Acidimicrobiales bacterium]
MATRIDADLLIPGRGEPVADGAVVFDGPEIGYAGPQATAPPADEVVQAPVVMPGLWDCHGHFLGLLDASLSTYFMAPLPLRAARAAMDAERALQAGFTSVREAGGLGVHLARAVDEGTVDGPSIYAPGAILSATGGHGDLHGLPLDWAAQLGERSGELWLCDGVDECIRAVRAQLRLNARVIKVCASGGVMSEVDHPVHQQFRNDELRAIVETAGLAERVVMAHCHGKPGIMAALEAGVRTIEHGTWLDDEACAAMRELGAIFVPTRYIVVQLLKAGTASGMSAANARKLAELADTHAGAIARAHQAGVRIAVGTDIFQSAPGLPVAWGANGAELGLLVDAGLSPLEAVEAATATAPDTLGPQAPRAGILAEGWDADVITVAADPLTDIAVLADPAQVTGVWKRGRRVKPRP